MPWRYPLVDGSGASASFARVRRAIENGFDRPREVERCLLVAWAGVLQSRLTRSERKAMAKRLKLILLEPEKAARSTTRSP